MTKVSELEALADWICLLNAAEGKEALPWLRFLVETKNLSNSTTLLLALVIFDGYELFPAHDATARNRPEKLL